MFTLVRFADRKCMRCLGVVKTFKELTTAVEYLKKRICPTSDTYLIRDDSYTVHYQHNSTLDYAKDWEKFAKETYIK